MWLGGFFKSRDIDFPNRHVTATSSVNNMYISILIVRGFIKITSKWGKKLFQSEVASTAFYFKVRQRQLFQSESMFILKRGNYFKVLQKLFQSKQLFQIGAKF